MRRGLRRSDPAAVVCCLLAATTALGQDDADTIRRLERQLRELDQAFRLAIPQDQPISERLMLDYGGSVRFGLLAVDDEVGTTRLLRQTDGILYLRAELDGAHRFFGRLRFLYNDFNSGDSFDGDGDELEEPIGDRYWYQFDLRGAKLAETGERPDYNVNLKAGRQFLQWGSGLALSEVLYAGRLDVEISDIGVIGLVGLTPSTGTIDFDGSRPGFDRDTDRAFFGGAVEYRGLENHVPYFSALVQRDHNDRNYRVFSTDVGDFPTRFNYDSEYYAIGSRGTLGPQLSYRIELVHERGEGLSSPFDRRTAERLEQRSEDIDAWAGILGLTYLFRDDHDSRLDLEFLGASGDDDRLDPSDTFGGNAPGTEDNAFNGLGYAYTGLALAPELSNLLSLRLGYSTTPDFSPDWADWLRVGVSGFLFLKADADAPLSVQTESSTLVGGEVDLFMDWRLLSDLSAVVRYGVFLPGHAIPEDRDDFRHFFYAGLNYAF